MTTATASDTTGSLAGLFGPESPLAAVLPGFAPREGQARMADAIADAIADGENLVVEAGTGTGKTLAYLVPVLLAGRRALLSTGTRNLQDQLFHRDLPAVSAALGRPARVVLLKGRANYLCLHRLESAVTELPAVPGMRRALRVVQDWSLRTRSGDIAEIEGLPEGDPIYGLVTSTTDNCLGSRCELYDQCHVVRARQAALDADIVVVNHHLLMADLVLKEEGFGELLPGCEAVIIDEAHQLPEVAQAFFNVSFGARSMLDLAADLRAEGLGALPGDPEPGRLADTLVKAVRDLRLELPRDEGTLMWEEVSPDAFLCLDEVVEALDDAIDWIEKRGESHPGLGRCLERACAAVERVERLTGADETAGLRWVALSRSGFVLNYTPVDIADSLRELLAARSCSWVFTSATLSVGDDFAHFNDRMGLDDPRTLAIPSPFDYANNALLYVPQGLPEPQSPNYTSAILEAVLPLVEASDGRAFLLFTSHRALQEAAAWLRARPDIDYPLLVQGEAARSKLLEQFVQLERPVLLGTSSFWEGVDIRGDHLVLVAIDKLPFASPGDPMIKARLAAIRQNGGNPFADFQVPQAALALKQGVGRLIRDVNDRGVVVVCDPRLVDKPYGRRFLSSLPPFGRTRSLTRTLSFLEAESN